MLEHHCASIYLSVVRQDESKRVLVKYEERINLVMFNMVMFNYQLIHVTFESF